MEHALERLPVEELMRPEPGDEVFEADHVVPFERACVFEFFADPANLEAITPPWLGFRIVERTTTDVRAGSRFTYRLKLHGLPMRWLTLIAAWQPEDRFVDVQLRGPYAKWRHLHTFEAVEGGTRIRDRVVYRLPFGWIGRFVAGAWVRADVRGIFAYRSRRIEQLLEAANGNDPVTPHRPADRTALRA